jgi:hypothetical protein
MPEKALEPGRRFGLRQVAQFALACVAFFVVMEVAA